MRVIAAIMFLVFVGACRQNVKAPFRITRFKSYPGGGFDKGGCDFIMPDSESPVFVTYDTLGYISIDDSVIVLSSCPSRLPDVAHYESKQFEVDVKETSETNGEYDYYATVTIKKRNVGTVTKNVGVRCGL